MTFKKFLHDIEKTLEFSRVFSIYDLANATFNGFHQLDTFNNFVALFTLQINQGAFLRRLIKGRDVQLRCRAFREAV